MVNVVNSSQGQLKHTLFIRVDKESLLESPHEDLSNNTQNVSKQSVLIEISVNQC